VVDERGYYQLGVKLPLLDFTRIIEDGNAVALNQGIAKRKN